MSEHGTRTRYVHGPCRCDPCRQANTDYQRRWDRAVHGRRPQKYGKTPSHGTIYCYSNGCRRPECRAAHRVYHRDLVARRRSAGLAPDDPRHGTLNAYLNFGCRCEPCRAAQSVANRLGRERRKRQAA